MKIERTWETAGIAQGRGVRWTLGRLLLRLGSYVYVVALLVLPVAKGTSVKVYVSGSASRKEQQHGSAA